MHTIDETWRRNVGRNTEGRDRGRGLRKVGGEYCNESLRNGVGDYLLDLCGSG